MARERQKSFPSTAVTASAIAASILCNKVICSTVFHIRCWSLVIVLMTLSRVPAARLAKGDAPRPLDEPDRGPPRMDLKVTVAVGDLCGERGSDSARAVEG